MKTFKQFLLEDEPTTASELIASENKEREDEINAMIEAVLSTASHDFIIESLDPSYRKMKQNDRTQEIGPNVFKVQTRTDRNPSDSKRENHEMFDKMFDENFGFKARSQAVFATTGEEGKQEIKNQYPGFLYMFFPTDPWQCVWSPEIEDLYSLRFHRYPEIEKLILNDPEYKADEDSWSNYHNMLRFFAKKHAKNFYKTAFPPKNGVEVMYKTPEYVIVKVVALENLDLPPEKFLELLQAKLK